MSKLKPKRKNRHLSLRERKDDGEGKEARRFLMPDAPKRKQKRKASPVRIACPLTVGTPTTPPPRKMPPWLQNGRHEIGEEPTIHGPSRMEDTDVHRPAPLATTNSPIDSETPKKNIKSAGIRVKRPEELNMQNVELLDVNIEMIGFTPTSSLRDLASLVSPESPASPSIPYDEIGGTEQLELCEVAIGENGSDIDSDDVDDENEGIVLRNRTDAEFPSDVGDSHSEEVLEQLQIIDDQDSAAMRQFIDNNDMLHFDWHNEPSVFKGTREVFTGIAGPTFSTYGLTPIEIFEKIWDSNVMGIIVQETNRYATQLLENSKSPSARIKRWQNISENDIWMYYAVLMLQSLVPHPVEKHYWYPSMPYLKIGNIQDLMSYKKCMLIKQCLHFVNNNITTGNDKNLAKIQPIIDHLNTKFGSLYQPEQCIAIDESLLLWKGQSSFSQLILTKAAQVGIKSYELCESHTGYLWSMVIFSGKGHTEVQERQDDEPEGATSQIVFKLVRPLLDKGHTLVMDNFYNSPLLSRALKKRKTDTMGTLRLNREFVPNSLRLRTKNNMRTGEVAFSNTHDLTVLVWNDNNLVSLLSTYHPAEVGGKEKNGNYKFKPQVVLDYNQSMGGVDKKDQLLQAFPLERVRNLIWYKKLFRRLLNVSVLNSSIIYNHNRDSRIAQRHFREILADQIIKKYGSEPYIHRNRKVDHFPMRNNIGKARCKWCAKRKIEKRTIYKCDTCDVALCVLDCFKQFHIESELKDSARPRVERVELPLKAPNPRGAPKKRTKKKVQEKFKLVPFARGYKSF